MIVTSKFDVALEQAFLDAKEPFDVAIYMAPGTEHAWPVRPPEMGRGRPAAGPGAERIRQLPHRRRRRRADQDGHRQDQRRDRRPRHRLPVEEQLRDHRGSLHRLPRRAPGRGSRAHADPGQAASVELPVPGLRPSRLAAQGLPALDLAGERPNGATHWAVQRQPDVLERRFWSTPESACTRAGWTDYVQGFDQFLATNRGDLR